MRNVKFKHSFEVNWLTAQSLSTVCQSVCVSSKSWWKITLTLTFFPFPSCLVSLTQFWSESNKRENYASRSLGETAVDLWGEVEASEGWLAHQWHQRAPSLLQTSSQFTIASRFSFISKVWFSEKLFTDKSLRNV